MVTKKLVNQVLLAALSSAIPGSAMYMHLTAGPPTTNPPEAFADTNAIPIADCTGEVGQSFTGANWNGGTEWSSINPQITTFTPVAGHAPLTAVGWVLMSADHSGDVLAYGDFEAPIPMLADSSAIVVSHKIVMRDDLLDIEVIVID